MSKITHTLATIFVLTVGVGISTLGNVSRADEASDNVVAVVNGTELTKNEFAAYVSVRIGQHGRPDALDDNQRKALLEEYINRELIYQDALANGLDKLPGVAEEIENQRRNILASYSVRRVISKPPTDEALHDAYQKQYARTNKEYNAKHILVKTEDEAKAIIAALDNGEDFSKLAEEKSLDSSAKQGGDLGWFSLEQMVRPFSDATAVLKKGEYTKTPVHTEFGWHVIKLEDTRDVSPPPFDSVKKQLANMLQNQLISDYVGQLRDKAKIEIK